MRSKSKWVMLFGIILIFCSFGLMLFTQLYANYAKQNATDVVNQLEEIMPPKSVGVKDTYSSMQMPSLEFDGTDYIGVLEIPDYNVKLPIVKKWDTKTLISFPQRFSGTVYDGSLIVGGFDQEGQFECLKRVDVGNIVLVKDMTGAQFSYTVDYVERKDSVRAESLEYGDSELTLFVRDTYSMKYIIVRCK